MFKKIIQVVAFTFMVVCGYISIDQTGKMDEAQRQFQVKVDTLHRDVIAYHDRAEMEAQTIAAALASPYYDRLRDSREAGHGILVQNWAKDKALWNHAMVISTVTKHMPDLQDAPLEAQRDYIATKTPANIILELYTANQNFEELRGRFYFNGIRTEGELSEVRTFFETYKTGMDKALEKANNWN